MSKKMHVFRDNRIVFKNYDEMLSSIAFLLQTHSGPSADK